MREAKIVTVDQLDFAVFCIEAIAEFLGRDQRDVLRALTERTNLLDDYIARFYDVLHTQDEFYIAEDIVHELAYEGVVL